MTVPRRKIAARQLPCERTMKDHRRSGCVTAFFFRDEDGGKCNGNAGPILHVMSLRQVLLFVPNLVGYCRLGLLGASLLAGTARPALTVFLFLVNFALDGVDGMLARALQQACTTYKCCSYEILACLQCVRMRGTPLELLSCPLCRPRRLVPS